MPRQLVSQTDVFQWIDLVAPTREELSAVAKEFDLPEKAVEACLDPEHLPKFEKIGDLCFVIFRSFDDASLHDADSVQELTRKIAIFYSTRFVITVHRHDHLFLQALRGRWKMDSTDEPRTRVSLIGEIIRLALESYEAPIDLALNQLEILEMGVFEAHDSAPFEIQEGYFLKRKASVFKRMLRASVDLLPKIKAGFGEGETLPQDLREEADSLFFYADELMEGVNNLLNLHLSLASQKTNEASHRTGEVVRVLTIFSVFLLPLNVLTGIYGMNFRHMPELEWRFGYPSVLLTMILVIGSTYLWFRRKGWLK